MSVKIAIVGMGQMGCNYLRMISSGQIENVEIRAITRITEERKEQFKEFLNDDMKICRSAEELFDAVEKKELNIDAVLIATPHRLHMEQAIRAMQLGLHVLCDKPAGVSYYQAEMIAKEYEKHKKLIYTMMFNQRMNPAFQLIKEIIENEQYGKTKRIQWTITDWYRPNSYYDSVAWRGTWGMDGGGILLNQCPHNLDILQWLVGMPEMVRAFCKEGKYHSIEVEDEVTAYMEFENGITGTFYASTGEASGINRLEISFENALLCYENEEILIRELEVNELDYRKKSMDHFAQPKGVWKTIYYEKEKQPHAKLIQNFVDAIQKKCPLMIVGTEGGKSLELSNAMYLSSWNNQELYLPKNEDEKKAFIDEFEEKFKTRCEKVVFFQ